jgi:hypothetical protein
VIVGLRDETSQRVELYDERKLWIGLFDPETSQKMKARLKSALRDGTQEEISRHRMEVKTQPTFNVNARALLKEARLPKNLTVAAIMTSGYRCVETYTYLNMIGKAERLVLIGYSSGIWDKSKYFSDGTPMTKRIFITEEDMAQLMKNASAPILFADNRIDTGLTVATIGNSLKSQFGYSGTMYQVEHCGYPMKWTGIIDDRYKHEASAQPTIAPILTDMQQQLACVQRSSSGNRMRYKP